MKFDFSTVFKTSYYSKEEEILSSDYEDFLSMKKIYQNVKKPKFFFDKWKLDFIFQKLEKFEDQFFGLKGKCNKISKELKKTKKEIKILQKNQSKNFKISKIDIFSQKSKNKNLVQKRNFFCKLEKKENFNFSQRKKIDNSEKQKQIQNLTKIENHLFSQKKLIFNLKEKKTPKKFLKNQNFNFTQKKVPISECQNFNLKNKKKDTLKKKIFNYLEDLEDEETKIIESNLDITLNGNPDLMSSFFGNLSLNKDFIYKKVKCYKKYRQRCINGSLDMRCRENRGLDKYGDYLDYYYE